MLSIPHMIVVFVIVLVVFGPQKLPELARGLGKLMAEFRKASTDFKSAFENEMRDLERQAAEVERKKRELLASHTTVPPQPATLATPSGAETQPGAAPLAAVTSAEVEKGATEAPVITPVAESVARITESPASENGSENGNGTAIPSHAEETPEDSAASKPLDTPHDYKQPA
jgi:sec-independent protein translocase protein TatB